MKKLKNGLTAKEWGKIKTIADVHIATTSFGASIILICFKAKVGPQETAMLQALYSRSPKSILKHLLDVAQKGADKFMEQYYVGYGHKSIGDCGNILIAYEGISMLAAKAVQDSQLYAGQEGSTRFTNYSNQAFLAPELDGLSYTLAESRPEDVETFSASRDIQERWRKFYVENLPLVQQFVMEQNPYEQFASENTEVVWRKTMNARAFDIIRAFLPAGATTCASWWTSISNAAEQLSLMRCHILKEAVELAEKTEGLLKEVYPSSFNREVHADREDYKRKWFGTEYYLEEDGSDFQCLLTKQEFLVDTYKAAILQRPKGVDIPWQVGEAFSVLWIDRIDYGSWRDQQRHRAVIQRMGLLTAKYGMREWYLENLPPAVLESAQVLITEQLKNIQSIGLDKYATQYLLPMGMQVPTRVYGSLSKIVYLVELRSQRHVHPTLHENAYKLASSLKVQLAEALDCNPSDIPMYIDDKVGELTLKRGTQDIVKAE
jgi:hypothetical protein